MRNYGEKRLGYSVYYDNNGIKCDVYLYDNDFKGIENGIEGKLVVAEFSSVKNVMQQAVNMGAYKSAVIDPTIAKELSGIANGKYLSSAYLVEYPSKDGLEPKKARSITLLKGIGGRFLKARVTSMNGVEVKPLDIIDIMDKIYQGISKEPDPLLKKAQDFLRKDTPQATVRPVQSANMHLGATLLMPQVVTKYRYYAAILAETTAAPVRKFLAVSQDGEAAFVELAKVADHLRQQDRNAWKDEDYVNAARLYVHMTTVANEDGWKLLSKPDDFTAIEFNMRSIREQHLAAQQIKPPTVTRRVQSKPDVAVTFYSWHLIGGGLKKWTVTFAATVSGSSEGLGNFGGGGYD